ncbi:MAG TPA: addiction module protein [Albitalea sp.]|nr:addiction module protein [Albitalea sp.]
MNARVDHVIDEALALAPDERSAVALALLDSLEGEDEAAVSDTWAEEIRLRREALRSGVAQPVPWAEARARLSKL